MSLVHFYYNPITELDGLFEDALAARLCPRACAPSPLPVTEAKHATLRHGEAYRPRMDLHESKDSGSTAVTTATFELPGLTSNDVTIEVHQNRLTISGKPASPDPEEGQSYVVRERRSGKFSRTLQLPFGTQPEDVKAKMENGILTITFPKTSPEQQAKRIVVE